MSCYACVYASLLRKQLTNIDCRERERGEGREIELRREDLRWIIYDLLELIVKVSLMSQSLTCC